MSDIEEKKNNEGNNKGEWGHLARVGLMVFITVVCCILFFFMLYRFKGFADIWSKVLSSTEPIIIGIILAYLMNPIMKAIERPVYKFIKPRSKSEEKAKKAARMTGIIGAVIVLIAIIAFLIASIVPALISSITSLVKSDYVNEWSERIQNGNFGDNKYVVMFSDTIENQLVQLQKWATDKLLPEMRTYIQQITVGIYGVVKSVFNFVIGIIVMIYVMSIQETLIGQAKKIIYAVFKPKRANVITGVFRKADSIFGGFITGKLIDSFIIGIICYVGCFILRIPDSVLVAVIIGVTNVIPVFGPFIGAIPCLVFVVIQSPIHALYLLIFIIVLQQVDGNIIGPKILGSSTGLSTFWVMFAILLFGGMFGFAGMLFGVPALGVIYYIVKRIVNYGLKKRGLPIDTRKYYEMKAVDSESNKLLYEVDDDENVAKPVEIKKEKK